MSKGCGCCADTRNARRDFRQDHGGGPEVPPHKPSKKYKKKHKHVWIAGPKYLAWESDSMRVLRYHEYCECGGAQERRLWQYKR